MSAIRGAGGLPFASRVPLSREGWLAKIAGRDNEPTGSLGQLAGDRIGPSGGRILPSHGHGYHGSHASRVGRPSLASRDGQGPSTRPTEGGIQRGDGTSRVVDGGEGGVAGTAKAVGRAAGA